MEKEIKHKGKVITKKHPSGMFEYYSDKQKRFLKFDDLNAAKSSIDNEGKKEDIKESVAPKTKKITLSELRSLVKNIIKEEQSKKKKVIKENKEDLIDFVVPKHYGSALINGDFSGLEDEDEEKIDDFISRVQSKYGNANFMQGDEEDDDLGFMSRSDIDNLGGNMMRIFIRPDRPMQESIKPKPQKIKLSEVRSLVRKMIKEENGSDFSTQIKEMFKSLDLYVINGMINNRVGVYETEKKDDGKKIEFGFENIDDDLPLMKFKYEGKNYKMLIPKSTITSYMINKIRSIINKNEAHKIKIGENDNPKSWGVGSFGVTKDVDLGEKPFEALDSSLKNTENLLKRVLNLSNKFNIGYAGNGHFEKQVVNQIMRKVRNDINKVSDKLIEDVLFYMEDHYDF
jgi:hypothetical protein